MSELEFINEALENLCELLNKIATEIDNDNKQDLLLETSKLMD